MKGKEKEINSNRKTAGRRKNNSKQALTVTNQQSTVGCLVG